MPAAQQLLAQGPFHRSTLPSPGRLARVSGFLGLAEGEGRAPSASWQRGLGIESGPHRARPCPGRGTSFALHLVLVDAATGIVKGLRLVSPPPEFADALRDAVDRQQHPYAPAAASRDIQALYRRYSSTALLSRPTRASRPCATEPPADRPDAPASEHPSSQAAAHSPRRGPGCCRLTAYSAAAAENVPVGPALGTAKGPESGCHAPADSSELTGALSTTSERPAMCGGPFGDCTSRTSRSAGYRAPVYTGSSPRRRGGYLLGCREMLSQHTALVGAWHVLACAGAPLVRVVPVLSA